MNIVTWFLLVIVAASHFARMGKWIGLLVDENDSRMERTDQMWSLFGNLIVALWSTSLAILMAWPVVKGWLS